MDLALIILRMGIPTLVSIDTGNPVVKENTFGSLPMLYMKENLTKVRKMERESGKSIKLQKMVNLKSLSILVTM